MICKEEEHEELVKLALELRDILFADASDMMQGAMVGSPVECVAFAKWWIQSAKGMQVDDLSYAIAFNMKIMSEFLVTKFICSKCGSNLQLTYDYREIEK